MLFISSFFIVMIIHNSVPVRMLKLEFPPNSDYESVRLRLAYILYYYLKCHKDRTQQYYSICLYIVINLSRSQITGLFCGCAASP